MPRLKYETKAIEIQMRTVNSFNGSVLDEWKESVDALCYGLFAIHPYESEKGRLHKITHIPTGLAICAAPSVAKAKRVVRVLQGVDIPWDSITVGERSAYKHKVLEISKALKAEHLIITRDGAHLAHPWPAD